MIPRHDLSRGLFANRWAKNFHLVLALVFFFSPGFSGQINGRVVGVSDGDTLTVLSGGKGEKIRLSGIDCPEKNQGFGQKAKQFSSTLAFGKEVQVRVISVDRYQRKVGEVTLPDGRVLNQELVRAGYAWWYRHYDPSNTTLRDLEITAREKRIGLWQDKNPVAPWEFRRLNRRFSRKLRTSSKPNSSTKKEEPLLSSSQP